MAKQSTNHLSISGSAFADLLSFTFRSSFELFSALLNTINVAQSKKKRILEGFPSVTWSGFCQENPRHVVEFSSDLAT